MDDEPARPEDRSPVAPTLGDVEPLVPTSVAARAIGVTTRTLDRYVTRQLVTPALTLPSGRYRWYVSQLLAQLNPYRHEAG